MFLHLFRRLSERRMRVWRGLMEKHYQEVSAMYQQMRIWRHDYKNHLQVMKAHMAAGRREELQRYLDDLEQNLDKVDTYVKSGNLMADAILNSKLSLIKAREIPLKVKASVPARTGIGEVELCVIIGNLLDNALESCLLEKEEKREK